MEYFVNVILPIPLANLFTYRLNPEEAAFLRPGMRVAVPFGRSKIYTALVHKLHGIPPTAYDAKEIYQLLDEQPLVTAEQLRHWEWMAEYYMCTLGEVFRAALPAAFLLESETLVFRNEEASPDEMQLQDDEFLVYEALGHQAVLRVKEVSAIVGKKQVLPLLNRLLQQNIIQVREALFEQYTPKMVRYVRLAEEFSRETALEELLVELRRAPRQIQVILALFQLEAGHKEAVKVRDLERKSGASAAVIRALTDKGVLQEFWVRTDRIPGGPAGTMPPKELNAHQRPAYEAILTHFEAQKVCLLHGVTASGKTEVYVRLIENCLKEGRQVLYLLPEIALTAQLIQRLQAYFGEKITVYHSRYSMPERVEAWNNVLGHKEKAQLIIGARSALFLPFAKLGLILIDEEHDASYKQFDPAPRYHARDAAIVLGSMQGANVLLGSATPGIESFYNVHSGKYGYARISQRFGNVLMPDIELVDIREAFRKKKMKGRFSDRLSEEIASSLQEGEQVILFQNRRGFAPVVECLSCGHSPQCPNCDVSLTYHRHNNQLRCHYCGHHTPLQNTCQACGNASLDTRGFGTEQVVGEVQELFPDAKVGRMDLDTTRGKYAYGQIIEAFEARELDILVGTQMVTKGLDFRNVNLVGIMNADSLLNFPDFRAHERSFQLLTQVAGRAGRTAKRGKVIIQTYNPNHQILKQVVEADYEGMYREQLSEREQYAYPPTNRLIRITFSHKEYNRVNEAAAWFGMALRQKFKEGILGPEFPAVARIRNRYLKNILVKIPAGQSLSKIKNSIKRIENSFNAISFYRAVRLIYNVDYI